MRPYSIKRGMGLRSMQSTAVCDECGKKGGGVILREQTGRDYRLTRKRLCNRCGTKLGYVAADFGRRAVSWKAW